jgi:hypothetical protein
MASLADGYHLDFVFLHAGMELAASNSMPEPGAA